MLESVKREVNEAYEKRDRKTARISRKKTGLSFRNIRNHFNLL